MRILGAKLGGKIDQKSIQKGIQKTNDFGIVFLRAIKTAQDGPKTAQDGDPSAKRVPRGPQDGPKRHP